MTLSRHLLCLTLCAWQAAPARAQALDELPEAADLVAGYRQNYYRFQTLRVTAQYDRFYHQNGIALFKMQPGITQEEVEQLTGPTTLHQQFLTDRIGFQLRIPDRGKEEVYTRGRTLVFPDSPVSPATLLSDYASMLIYNFDGRRENGLRFWAGQREGRPQAAIVVKLPENRHGAMIPPLGLDAPFHGFKMHEIDRFLLVSAEALHVVGREPMGGRDTYVLEKTVEAPDLSSQWLRDPTTSNYAAGFQAYRRYRAWADPARGCIPIRLEEHYFFTHNGRRYDNYSGLDPVRVTEVTSIEAVRDGGFYPNAITTREYTFDASERRPIHLPGAIIEGAKDTRRLRAPLLETRFRAHSIEARFDPSDAFHFEFPEGTLYFDHRVSKGGFAVGEAGDLMHEALRRENGGPQASRPVFPPRWVLVGVNGALLLCIGLMLYFRIRRKRQASSPGRSTTSE